MASNVRKNILDSIGTHTHTHRPILTFKTSYFLLWAKNPLTPQSSQWHLTPWFGEREEREGRGGGEGGKEGRREGREGGEREGVEERGKGREWRKGGRRERVEGKEKERGREIRLRHKKGVNGGGRKVDVRKEEKD